MGNLNIEIPDEECVKLFRYEDGDGVAAYLLLFPEHDMKAVKPRIDAQLDHEMAMSVNASNALFGGVVDRPPQRVGRVDVDGVRAGALDGSFDGNDRTVPGRQMGVEHRLELLALAAWRGRYVLLVRRAGTYRISGQRGREEGAQGRVPRWRR